MVDDATGRPVFHPKLGQLFAGCRAAKGWSVQQAVNMAHGRKHTALTPNRLRWLEEGRTKAPDQDVLRAVCDIYGLDYREIATAFIEANYGRDLVRHLEDQQSGAGGTDVPASARRIAQLEQRIKDYETTFREMQGALTTLSSIAVRLHENENPGNKTAARHKRHRKTG
ncbi:MAG TPA: helix-turn-helix transcriptional regulator [Vicinamibacterales bacterium]|nr:helix-turn-helix transcriptional regulator [Vicinamibacterales bacterium]